MPPAPRLPTRFLFDLEPFVRQNKPLENPSAARMLMRHFVDAVESGAGVDPLVRQYIEHAIARARASPKPDLYRELGLKRPRAGNPGGASSRRLSPGDHEEIPLIFAERMLARHELIGPTKPRAAGEGSDRDKVIRELAREYRASIRTIESCVTAGRNRQKLEFGRLRN